MPGQNYIEICEVGPRDGFQFEDKPIPTAKKLEIIRGLVAAGLPRIQVTSFVHPEKVPQMADAENLMASLSVEDTEDPSPTRSVIFSGLCLNMKGVLRAAATGLKDLDLSIATNESHGLDNASMTVEQGVIEAVEMVTEAHKLGLRVQLGLQTVFGYGYPGDTSLDEVILIAEKFSNMNVDSISIADTTGMANPKMIRERVSAVKNAIGETPLVLHLHDTRGLGLANVVAAWESGVSRFDTSLGGLGGCPFIKGATGNVPTEDVVYLFEELGLETGIDNTLVAECSRALSDHLGRNLSGKMYQLV